MPKAEELEVSEEERLAAKAERKRLRAAKKAAKQAAASSKEGEDGAVESEAKTAKKERKRLRKLAKAAKKDKEKDDEEEEEKEPDAKRRKTGSGKTEQSEKKSTVSGPEFRKLNEMEIKAKDETGAFDYEIPSPCLEFTDANFEPSLTNALMGAGFANPTPIQAQSWPIVTQGRDIISVARTGSGKTLGFLAPIFERISQSKAKFGHGPSAIVLAPTRELAMQIHDEAEKFGRQLKAVRMRSVAIYGGDSKWRQISNLERNRPQIVIATPGRLNDLATMRKIDLSGVCILALDEADRMLDMGFEPQLYAILSHMPEQTPGYQRPLCSAGPPSPKCRQTLFYTATWPKSVQTVASKFLHNPVQVNVGKSGQLVANEDIEQRVLMLDEYDKKEKLLELVKALPDKHKTLIFFNMKVDCQGRADELWESGLSLDSLHGNKDQRERSRIMRQFKEGDIVFLCATDVAARGLDVKDITHVINYDFPMAKNESGIEDYVHRIGRTGRAGAKGTATTFFTKKNAHNAGPLLAILEGAKQEVPAELRRMAAMKQRQKKRWNGGSWGRKRGGGGGGRGGGRGGARAAWGGQRKTF